MRVLMLGWEFPPNQSGGLGTACYGITRALLRKGTDVLFVLPSTTLSEHPESHVKLRSASGTLVPELAPREEELRRDFQSGRGVPQPPMGRVRLHEHLRTLSPASSEHGGRTIEELHTFTSRMVMRGIRSSLRPYTTPESYEEYLTQFLSRRSSHDEPASEGLPPLEQLERFKNALAASALAKSGPGKAAAPAGEMTWTEIKLHGGYGKDLMSEVYRFSIAAAQIAMEEDFDVIHVHDWMTYPAGILIKQLTGKPLVAHIHALEHDRSGEGVNPEIAHIEWAGMTAADTVVAVSYYTKNEVMRQYAIPEDKIQVVHNAVNRDESQHQYHLSVPPHKEKRVLFMGRITYQKGPDYFVEAARLVHERMPDVHFVMAGSGDMFYRMVRRVAQLRMGTVFHFPGFQKGTDIERMYASCDLYVMPSVSEPFGIAPLEAMICDTPVILSRQSGVSEVVHNALKVDFWDIHEMANKICAVLAYPRLAEAMVRNSREDLRRIRWSTAAARLNDIYRDCLNRR